MRALLCSLFLLCACVQNVDPILDVTVKIRPYEYIAEYGERFGYRGALGLAFKTRSGRCIIYVPPLKQNTVHIWIHELRHCREGKFHE